MKYRYSKYLNITIKQITIVVISIFVIFPVLWMFLTSIKPDSEMFITGIHLIPKNPTLVHYIESFRNWPLITWLLNSFVIMIIIIVGSLLTSILAAYGFSRYKFVGKNIFFLLVIGSLIVPFPVTMIPNYILISSLRGINTHWGVALPFLAKGFGIFLLRQAMLSIPSELYDAAIIDGANSWQVLWRIVVPACKATIITLLILLGLQAWNMYFWPMLVLTKPEIQTVPVGIRGFQDAELGFEWGKLMAVASVASIPALVIYAFFQRFITGAHLTSGLK